MYANAQLIVIGENRNIPITAASCISTVVKPYLVVLVNPLS